MKITKSQLKQIIKEELDATLKELRQQWARQEKRVKLSDRFGPEEVEEMAKELALRAGAEDRVTYDWEDFMDQAKEELMHGGL
jgi:hypothetical protein